MVELALEGEILMTVELPEDYKPSVNEEYMSPMQLEYFRHKLLAWRQELLDESQQTINHLREENQGVGDEVDRANSESETSLELRTRDRYRKLLGKIDSALQRIENGSYGYCEVSGEEIGLKRLDARPIASMTVEAQERHERTEGHFADAR
jgi:DnaK suppressor protein